MIKQQKRSCKRSGSVRQQVKIDVNMTTAAEEERFRRLVVRSSSLRIRQKGHSIRIACHRR